MLQITNNKKNANQNNLKVWSQTQQIYEDDKKWE